MTSLIVAAINAPLVAVAKRWPDVFHAAGMDTIVKAWPNGTVTAACGARGLRLLLLSSDPLLWPVRVKGLPEGKTRCVDCWHATGRKKPRCSFEPREVA